MTTLSTNAIDRLIERRNKLTTRRDGLMSSKRLDAIDRKLATVPAGQRNDVDLLLGRPCAALPDRAAVRWSSDEQRAAWQREGAMACALLAAVKQAEFDAYMHQLCADTEPSDSPSHDGMWK